MTKTLWPERFLEGVKLFNNGHFFETHEVWEDVWRAAPKGERDFYQGMIHLTVALYQAQRQNWRAAYSQLRRAAWRLAAFEPARGQLDLCGLQSAVAATVARLEEGGAAVDFPKIRLTPVASHESLPGQEQ